MDVVTLVDWLSKYGLWTVFGITLFLSISVVVTLWKALREEQRAHRNALREHNERMVADVEKRYEAEKRSADAIEMIEKTFRFAFEGLIRKG